MPEQTATFRVTNMRCAGCASTIERAARGVTGVTDVTVDLTTKQVAVSYDDGRTGAAEIKQAIAAAGSGVAQ